MVHYTPARGFVPFGPVFPHGLDVFGDPTGPYKAVPFGRGFMVAQSATPTNQDARPNDHAMLEVEGDRVARVVNNDFWNPFDFLIEGTSLYVVDAARNDVERLAVDGTGKTTLFTFARLQARGSALQRLSPTEFDKSQPYEFDAVPTGIAARDGRLYVSLFAGFPFLPGAGRVVSLSEPE